MIIDINTMIQNVWGKYFRGRSVEPNTNVMLNQKFNHYLSQEVAPHCVEEYGGVIPYSAFVYFDFMRGQLNLFCTELLLAPRLEDYPRVRYNNECSRCIFFGCYFHYDLYACHHHPTGTTLIARYGDEATEKYPFLQSEFLRCINTEEGYKWMVHCESKLGRAFYIASDCYDKRLRVNLK